jgi:DNA invertase Pin-like site-specific DNA recombinase
MNATPRSLSPSPKVQPWHLDRNAIVYVRQSTPQPVLDHRESTARQYALADRAVALGGIRSEVITIDDDLGKSGQSIEGRPGFQRRLAEVARNRVGLILGLERSRRARSCQDGHQLLEWCARFRVLLADADGVDDPTEHSDRLILGLHGMMNEAELHVLQPRMHPGKLNQARRGERIVSVPVGDLKHPSGPVTVDPDEQVPSIVRLIFDEFDRQGTVHGILRHLIAQGIRLPIRSHSVENAGQLEWRQPGRETIRPIRRHPIDAGAYRDGHRTTDPRRQQPGRPKTGRVSGRPAEDGLVFLRDRFPAYISWDRFEANQERLAANRSRVDSAGAVRNGSALLAGVVRCGRCGKRMDVRYKRSGRPSYGCTTLPSDYGLPACPSASAAEIAEWVAEQVLAALRPAALEASLNATQAVEEQRRRSVQQWQQRIERAQYEAQRAARQYHACEPENRLVADPGEALGRVAARGGEPGGRGRPVHAGAASPFGGSGSGAGASVGRAGPDALACRDDDTRRPAADRETADRARGGHRRPGRGASHGADRLARRRGSNADVSPPGGVVPSAGGLAAVVVDPGRPPRAESDAGPDRGGAQPSRLPAAEPGGRVPRRDGASAARRTGVAAPRIPPLERVRVGRGREVVARVGPGTGALAAHTARLAEEGLVVRPATGRPRRRGGGVGQRNGTGPVAGAEVVSAPVVESRAPEAVADTPAETVE